jgi:hypothetical protein
MRKLAAIAVVVALMVVAAIAFVRSRPATTTTSPSSSQPSSSSTTVANKTDARTFPKTSEELIAAALQAKEISYEQSLLARAYALYDDPRLPKEFRSPVIEWEAATAIALEIESKETTLSNDVLAQLAPFRTRPNDPISIFNRSRAEVLQAQNRPATGWAHRKVPNTNVRIWIKGMESQLDRFEPMVRDVWAQFPAVFPYPNQDDGSTSSQINPDTAIDIYFMNGGDIDPRFDGCAGQNPNQIRCTTSRGVTWSTTPKAGRSSSGYCLVITGYPDDQVLGTIAHELAHVTQMKYDYHEHDLPKSKWLTEGSASWVEHQILKLLKKTPTLPYEHLSDPQVGIFYNLHKGLDERHHYYGTWLYFYFASMEFGDRIVTSIWEAASRQALDGASAVERYVPFDDYFPRFAVRNWNEDPVLKQYRTQDGTFPRHLKPYPLQTIKAPPNIFELAALDEPIPHLASAYFHFTFPAAKRRVTFENLYASLPQAHVWAMRKIGRGWHDPEDWSRIEYQTFCRDIPDEDLSELVLVVSNTSLADPLPEGHPKPRVLSEENGCPFLEGWAQATLRVKDDGQDATYTSNRVQLKFRPRANQDQAGNVQYDLEPTPITWTASGRKGDCTLSGAATMTIGGPLPVPSNGSGYMNVVGLDGGDFHSIVIIASPRGPIKKTCPGPRITNDYVPAGVLLQILSEPNKVENGEAVYKGQQTLDLANPFANLPAVPGAPSGAPRLPNLPNIPGVAEALKGMAARSTVYTFQWELKPKNGALPPSGGTPFK